MAQRSDRLERLIANDIGECCEEDIDTRLQSLRSMADAIPSEIDREIAAMRSLGNGTRYTIVRLLIEADRELCVCEITPVMEVSDSAVSHALSDLHDVELVDRRKDGTWRFYRPTSLAKRLVDAIENSAESR